MGYFLDPTLEILVYLPFYRLDEPYDEARLAIEAT